MLQRIILLFLFLLSGTVTSFAQKDKVDPYYVPDTLSATEIAEINAATRNSTFGSIYLADSFSKIGDSIIASNYFLKTDPCYLLFEGLTPNSIDTFIANHFKLTEKARKKYVMLFTKMYNRPKSKAYADFKRMADEDQAIRTRQVRSTDSAGISIADEEMLYTDSVHFSYLYNYIKSNGWPALSNGSMYASLLAIHDHAHADEYIPLIKKAVLEGQVMVSALHLIVYWHAHNKGHGEDLKYYILVHPYVKFDISSVIGNDSLPPSMPEIRKALQAHCHEKLFYVSESKNIKLGSEFCNKLFAIDHREDDPLSKMNKDLAYYSCGLSSDERSAMEDGLWEVDCFPADHEDLKLFLYITFESKEGDIKFQRMLANKKYTSHVIQFDYDSSSITSENINFISRLAEWLKQNPSVSLEIDGHTDNEGAPEVNLKLSQDRADEVKKQLITRGIAETRLTTKGYGDTKPIDSNSTPEGKAKNRRVEFIKL